ncbi:GroES-like protein [Acaromyces ingoldii]|uniref:GroES-like protein n=1 Tax=Acaromyces ingoldii TaxID=215250 RepID=A0A316YCP6_9BASI|nr:GroES-like protein [Acaromyces ingoldii]PWN87470.1 GroES-like protein [Acaromyces ingoldii]
MLAIVTESADAKPVIKQVPKPTVKDGFVVVKIMAAGLNPSDLLNAKGSFPYTTYPRILGRDWAGVVEEGPSHLVGNAVFGTSGKSLSFDQDGTFAQYCLIAENSLTSKPASLGFIEAASLGIPLTTAQTMLHRAMVKEGDVVLVTGAKGAVGSAACLLARQRGCRVLRAYRSAEADVNLTSSASTLKSLTPRPDVILETTGNLEVLSACVAALANFGRLAFISAPRTGSKQLSIDVLDVYRRQISLLGCNTLLATPEHAAQQLESIRPDIEAASISENGKQTVTVTLEEAVSFLDGTRPLSGRCIVSFC